MKTQEAFHVKQDFEMTEEEAAACAIVNWSMGEPDADRKLVARVGIFLSYYGLTKVILGPPQEAEEIHYECLTDGDYSRFVREAEKRRPVIEAMFERAEFVIEDVE